MRRIHCTPIAHSPCPHLQALLRHLWLRVRHAANRTHRCTHESLVPVQHVRLQLPQNRGAVVFRGQLREHVELESAREQRIGGLDEKLLEERPEYSGTLRGHGPAEAGEEGDASRMHLVANLAVTSRGHLVDHCKGTDLADVTIAIPEVRLKEAARTFEGTCRRIVSV